jgi:hypothetical protein
MAAGRHCVTAVRRCPLPRQFRFAFTYTECQKFSRRSQGTASALLSGT